MEFESIKNSIQQFTLSSIIDNSLTILNRTQIQNKKNIAVWNILILVKWAYLYTNDKKTLQKASFDDIDQLISMVEKYEYQRSPLDFKHNVKRSLRIVAYQQFWFQERLFMHSFQRQIVLYLYLESSFDIDGHFRKLSGLSIKEFLNLCFVTNFYLNKDKLGNGFVYDGALYEDYFEIMFQLIPPEKLKIYLNMLTLKYVQQVENAQKMVSKNLQLYETNFWSQSPFIIYNNKPQVLHSSIFSQTAKYFLYDFMKANHKDFTTEFGKRVERYLELGLKEVGIDYSNESSLKKEYKFSKVSDYMIESNILIECKAIELHPRSGIIRDPDILKKDFRDSVIKAYKQLLSTANSIDSNKEWFGVIVTYKDTFIGYGVDAWNEFLESPIKEFLLESDLNISLLPPVNLCFIEIQTWDRIIQIIKNYNISFTKLIENVLMYNSTAKPEDNVLLIEQAIDKIYPIAKFDLAYLNEADNLLDIIPS